jgi:RNA polymerase sigma-70 factor (ECF subfamily)
MAKVIQGAHLLHSSSQQPTSDSTEGTGSGSGSLDDFQTIYREHYPAIWRFLLHLGVRKSDVADVTHNVFLIAYRKLGTFEHRSSMRTWLCGIAFRVGRGFLKSSAVRLEVSDADVGVTDTGSPDSSLEMSRHSGELALAERLLEALPAEQREVFVLHELEQMTGTEIAELMGTSLGTVRSRLRRARDSFRKQLAELGLKGAADV